MVKNVCVDIGQPDRGLDNLVFASNRQGPSICQQVHRKSTRVDEKELCVHGYEDDYSQDIAVQCRPVV